MSGRVLGNLAFLPPGPRSTTAVVIRNALLLVLERAALDILEQRGEHDAPLRILESIVKTVAGQLRWARSELVRIESGEWHTPIARIMVQRLPRGELCKSDKELEMAWAILVIAGLFEMGWAIGLKYTEGFTRLWPTVWTLLSIIISLGLLGIAMKSLPVGTAYAVWVGVGAVGTVILGMLLFGEPAGIARLISIALILAGIIGLRLTSSA